MARRRELRSKAFRSARAISKIDIENEHSLSSDVESKLTVGWQSVGGLLTSDE